MIVHCPSCSTRYHHQAVPESLLASAHCSECDVVFPLKAPRRRYVLVPTTGGARLSLGMDDDGLAAPIRQVRPERGASAVVSYTSHTAPISEERTTAWPLVENDGEEIFHDPLQAAGATAADPWGAEPSGSDAAGTMEASGLWTPAAALEGQARTEPMPEAPARPGKRGARSETLVAVAPACAGAGLAYYLAGGAATSPWASVALGGVLGLLVGWGCLRWMRREN